MIEFKNIYKSFKDKHVLEDVSFSIDKGEFVCIIGPSGCGKTTALKMINRLIKPTRGAIYVDGKDISKEDEIDLRRNIGYVIQQTGLFPHMTVKENIELIPKLKNKKDPSLATKVVELLDMVGLDPEGYMNLYPTQMSGGQQQRVGVARAFASDPEIILMDEPFSALDPITREQLQDELLTLQNKLHKTIIFVTHDMAEAIKMADRICIMSDGRVHLKCIKAVNIMYNYKVDSLMIVDNHQNFLGILDANQAAREKNRDKKDDEVMHTECLSVKPDESIVDVINLANSSNIYTLPVVDDKNKLVGLITKSTLVTTLSKKYDESEDD